MLTIPSIVWIAKVTSHSQMICRCDDWFFFLGVGKTNSVEQPILIGIVLQFVQQFVPDFYASDISWVRSLKSAKFGVLNVQCRTVMAAARVRSTFASLVKTKPVPPFIGKVVMF